ncbi:hypothetical protein KHC28_10655, partial [Ancylobacter sonchi]|uniref:hypothetical protein n=1 Tax=Ancylobacter sonchi TaxID=1937790 RepID=UPI001BD3E84F
MINSIFNKVGIILAILSAIAVWDAQSGQVSARNAATRSAPSIVVEGNRRVDAETIRSYFGTPPLTPAKIDEGLKALYA